MKITIRKYVHFGALAILLGASSAAIAQEPAPAPCAGLPPGKHSLLERFTAQFGLSCEQQLKIEPLLHAEESVSKPLLAFSAFSPEQRNDVMLKIKVAARRQIRGELTPEQQNLMDGEIESVAKAPKGGKKESAKKAPAKVDPFQNEEALSQAIANYAALTPAEKAELTLEVKKAALADSGFGLTPDQRQKLEADVKAAGPVAATPQHRGPRSQLQNQVDKLNVTPEQRAKLDSVLDADAKAVRALRGDASLNAEERQKKKAAIRAETEAKIKPILTAEQWKKLEELRAERKAQAKSGKKK